MCFNIYILGTEFEDIKSKDVPRVKRALVNIRAALEQRSVLQHKTLLISCFQSLIFQFKSALLHFRGGHFPEEYAIIDTQVVHSAKLTEWISLTMKSRETGVEDRLKGEKSKLVEQILEGS